MPDAVETLVREVRSLARQTQGWSPARWSAPAGRGAVSRRDRLATLVADLADLGRAAGGEAPARVVPPRLGDHALGDQLLVVTADLVAALRQRRPPDHADLAARALTAVLATRDALRGTGAPGEVPAATGAGGRHRP